MDNRNPNEEKMNGPEKGPNAVPEKGPNAVPEKGPNAVPDKGPNAVPDKGPNTVPNKEPNKGPNRRPNKGPNRRPNTGNSKRPSRAPNKGPNTGSTKEANAGPSKRPNKGPSKRPNRGPSRIKKEQHNKKGKEILINVGPIEKRIAALEGGELVDFFMERKSLEHYAGSIYKGKVSSIIPGIEASFVDIGHDKNGFLHVSDVVDKDSVLRELLPGEDENAFKGTNRKGAPPKINDILKPGEEIMVQVVKEAISTKGPRLTTFVSIPGRYMVLTPYDTNLGISRRIVKREERKRIKDIVGQMGILGKVGCIVRTAAENRSEEELRSELNYLINLWDRIKARSEKQAAPVAVYEEYGVVLRVIRDTFTTDVETLIVDSKEEYNRILKFLKAFMPQLKSKVKLYSGKTPLFQKHGLDRKIDQIFERKVDLPNGGNLVIEQTEGLVAIDVNTGSFVGKKGLEDTAFKTNLESAEEIPRQLILRDVGGIVIIDFIDMDRKEHRDRVFNTLTSKLEGDKARVSVRGISQFGVVEMTRQRMRKSLENASFVECPFCGGKGVVKSIETIAIEAVRRIDMTLSSMTKRRKHIKVFSNPSVNEALVSDQARMLSDIQRKYSCKIDIIEDKTLHVEDVMIEEV